MVYGVVAENFKRKHARKNRVDFSVVFYDFLSALVYCNFKAFTDKRIYGRLYFVRGHLIFFHTGIIAKRVKN